LCAEGVDTALCPRVGALISCDMGLQREGWFEDPSSRHELRWFSQGRPTDLVRDGKQDWRDPLSIDDTNLFQSMDLKEAPDEAPLIVEPDPGGHQVMTINVGTGPVFTVPVGGNQLPDYRNRSMPAGMLEIIFVISPILVAVYFLVVGPLLVVLALSALSLLLGAAGARRRRRQARKWLRRSD
jgi:hypothetical protein